MEKYRFLLSFILAFTITAVQSQQRFIKAGKLVDVKNNKILSNQIIELDGNRIVKVSGDIEIPDSAEVIDLSGHTVMPGLIDAHTHLLYLEDVNGSLTEDGLKAVVMEGDALRALRGADRAKTFLEAGFTSVKDLGNSGQHLDWALKVAIFEGSAVGPRMFVSGPIISSEGGQFPGLQHDHSHIVDAEYRIVRGVEDAINAVRENLTYGSDVIKICADNSPGITTLTMDEMKAIVQTAHRYNRPVTAHATTEKSTWEAVQAGVDGIEHGYIITDTTMKMIGQKGIYLVPTFGSRWITERYMRMTGFEGTPEEEEAYIRGYTDDQDEIIQLALKHKVKIVAGSDCYFDYDMPQGKAAMETLISYYESGMTPVQVIKSATLTSAEFMKLERFIGSIEEGKLADIVAVPGDLEKDFSSALRNVSFVMKDGAIYVQP